MNRARLQLRRGYMLLEMLVVVGIVAIALVIQAHVFHASMQAIGSAPAVESQLLSINQVNNILRRDVWGASNITVSDSSTISLAYGDGRSIRWTFAPGATTRTDSLDAATSRGPQTWKIDAALHADREGPAVVLRGTSDREQSLVPERRFFSQVMLASQGRQP